MTRMQELKGARVLKNGCVAQIAGTFVRGDLWIVGCVGDVNVAAEELTYLMRVTDVSYSLSHFNGELHAEFYTFYHWFDRGTGGTSTVLLPRPDRYDYDGLRVLVA